MTAARLLVLAGLLLLGAAAAPGFAHNLVTSETAPGSWGSSISIDDPTVSRVYVSTGVPVIGRLSGFRPFSAIVGPGLPPAGLGFELPPAAGAQVLAPGSSPREFHEGVTGTDSWIVMEETVTLPAAGEYWFVAFAGDPAEAAARARVPRGEVAATACLASSGTVARPRRGRQCNPAAGRTSPAVLAGNPG